MSRPPELLAPAGDQAALAAALAAGADAVYFGLDEGFNARARAANFKLDALRDVCAQVHRASARAYLAFNTLVFEGELERAEAVLRQVAEAGVDALIVQDPAVALLARALCPQLEVHASTQMTICNADAARFAAGLGITRVVVPRELSVTEIARFQQETPLELEVFVHGALCVSWSGQCLTSEAWGGRSANRGQCAQSCRMPYDLLLDGERRDLGDLRYLLSPKDLAGARALPELVRLGVHGLKIEGRQKGSEYVASAVGGYRRWLDALLAGADRAAAERQLALDLRDMTSTYSRGFGDGFLAGANHQDLVEGRFPKHRGHYLGRVVAVEGDSVTVALDGKGRPWTGARALAARPAVAVGDLASPLPAPPLAVHAPDLRPGLGVVFDAGQPESAEPGGPVFRVEVHGERVRLGFGTPGPDLLRVRVGDRVWITSDPDAVARAAAAPGRVDVDLHICGAAGAALVVEAHAGTFRAVARSASLLQPARGPGLDAAVLRDKLAAFGGTPFRLRCLHCEDLAAGLHLPVSELKEMRRELAAALLPQIERGAPRQVASGNVLSGLRQTLQGARGASRWPPPASPLLVPLVRTDAQLDAVLAAGLPEVELDFMELTGLSRAVERARARGVRVVVATLRVSKPGERAFDERLGRLRPDGVLLRHLGAVMLFTGLPLHERPVLHGDFALNVCNALTAGELFRLGLDTLTPAHDLDAAQWQALVAATDPGRLTATLHVRMPTFHTEHCVYAHTLSAGRDFNSCGRPCERHHLALRDHLGFEHPVIVDAGCRNTVFNGTLQTSAAAARAWIDAGVRRFRVEFVRENQAQAAAVLGAYVELLAGRLSAGELQRRLGAEAHIGVAKRAQATSV